MSWGIHLGSFLLFAAFVLLLIATLSSPIINNVAFLDVTTSSEKLQFGTFGYCQTLGSDQCSSAKLGYNIASLSGAASNYTWVNTHLETVTKAFILHPIACGIAFLALLVALPSHHIGFIVASLVTFVAFIVSLAAMVIDFVVFGIVRHEINNNTTAHAGFASAIWLVLAATVVLFFATFIVLFECCTVGRRRPHVVRPPAQVLTRAAIGWGAGDASDTSKRQEHVSCAYTDNVAVGRALCPNVKQ